MGTRNDGARADEPAPGAGVSRDQATTHHQSTLTELHGAERIAAMPGPVVIHADAESADAAHEAGLEGAHVAPPALTDPRDIDMSVLRSRYVVMVQDQPAGDGTLAREEAKAVTKAATAAGAQRMHTLRLPTLACALAVNGDVIEWLQAGGTREQWRAMVNEADPWPAPEPLPRGLAPVMPFDGDLLPDALRGYVLDIAERMQCPPDFPAVALVVSMAAMVGRRCGIRPKRQDDWLVVPNLWGGIIGRPSVMKTPAVAQATRPLDALIARAREVHEGEFAAYEVAKEVHAGQRKAWQEKVREAGKAGRDTVHLARERPSGPIRPLERRYRTNAGSVECLINLLNENPAGLLVFRDELVGWLRGLDRPGREGDRQFFLEAWNGTGAGFDYDTFAHGHLHCQALCLSVLGSIQPGPLSHLLADAAKGGGGDDGLLQRFQLLVYPDTEGRWRNVDRWPDTDARKRVQTVFERLDAMPLPVALDEGGITDLRFANAAQDQFDKWRRALEDRIRGEADPMLEAHLAKYRSLQPSLALLFHLAELADLREALCPVSEQAAIRAAAWCDYLESHARRIYGMRARAEVEGAERLLRHIRAGDLPTSFSARDARLKGWSRLSTPEEVGAALSLLEDFGWVLRQPVETGARGGRPTTRYRLNPKAEGGP